MNFACRFKLPALGGVLAIVSFVLCLWGWLPGPRIRVSFPIKIDPAAPGQEFGRSHYVLLDAPKWVRAGEDPELHIWVKNEQAEAAQGEIEPRLTGNEAFLGEAWVDISGAEVMPGGKLSQPLPKENEVHFLWRLVSHQKRDIEGTVWFFVRVIPVGGGKGEEYPVMAYPLKVSRVGWGWFSIAFGRWVGGTSWILTGFIFFKFFHNRTKTAGLSDT